MVKKEQSISIEELTKKEISVVDAEDKLAKFEKAAARDKKIIAEYKEREKASARALVLFERKLKYLKTSMIEELLKICSKIKEYGSNFDEELDKFNVSYVKKNYESISTEIYNVCNKIESNAVISNEDRAFISNKKIEKPSSLEDSKSRFDRLKEQFNQRIGASVMRKPGRPKKEDQSIVADIGLGKKVEKKVKENDDIEAKLKDLFYQAPTQKTVVSAIPQTSDSIFDFNEALNPNISLKDIMADLMVEKTDEVKVYSADTLEKDIAEVPKNKIEMIESGFLSSPKIRKSNIQNRTIDKT